MLLSSVFLLSLFAALLLTLYAAISDVKSLIIPNWISVSIVALYPLAVWVSPVDIDWISGLITGGIAFVLGFGLFALGLFGGGDVKLAAALSFWAGSSLIAPFLVVVTIGGGLLVLFILVKGVLQQPDEVGGVLGKVQATLRSKTPVPYGVAIALGSAVIFYHHASRVNVFG